MPTGSVIVAGATSGVGKTTISLAVMYALRKKGYTVQPFKVGPDFIDPSYHALITGRTSRNLDPWLMRKQGVVQSFLQGVTGIEIAVIEGVMGLYDGVNGKSDYASTASIAKLLDSPVLLVIDGAKAGRSIAALALGMIKFDPRVRIAGIIVNNIGSDKHSAIVKEAFARKIRVPIVGLIRRSPDFHMDARHLGLVPAEEMKGDHRKHVVGIAMRVAEQLDVDRIVQIVKHKKMISLEKEKMTIARSGSPKIAIALDESFNFYYTENIELLRRAGASIVFFSPVRDKELPADVDGLVIGGGFPEILADRLEKNQSMMRSISSSVNDGMPLYAECGGLMYLTRSITGYKDNTKRFKMVCVLDADTRMTKQLTLNYTLARSDSQILGGGLIRGHEFHYSKVENVSNDSKFAYNMKIGKGAFESKDGFMVHNCLASYMHIHFVGKPRLASHFVKSCNAYSRR